MWVMFVANVKSRTFGHEFRVCEHPLVPLLVTYAPFEFHEFSNIYKQRKRVVLSVKQLHYTIHKYRIVTMYLFFFTLYITHIYIYRVKKN